MQTGIKSWGGVLLCVLGLVGVSGCNSQGDAGEVSFDVPVVLATAELGRVEQTLTTTGTVQAGREARLLTPIGGNLLMLKNRKAMRPYRDGDPVQAGTVIAIVEAEEQQVSKGSGIAAKKARLEAAEAELKRKQRLHAEKIISDADLKSALSEAATALYDYEQSLIVRAQTKVTSPMAGILADITRQGQGERVGPSFEVGRVVDFQEVIVEGRLSASDIAFVKENQIARVTSYSYQGKMFEGVVTNVAPTVDADTRTFLVEVKLMNPEGLLRPGLFVKVEIVVEERDDVVVVPKDAVVLRNNRPVVFTVQRQTAKESRVVLGLDGGNTVEIVEGLDPEERYVTVGQQTLSDKSPVRPR